MLNVTTNQLQYLVTVSRSQTMADAAETLRISASALSQGLTELERRLGLELFERQGRAKVLTAQGRQAVHYAERVLSATRDLTIWVEETRQGARGQVRLGLIDIAAVHYFPKTLIEYRAARPGVEVHLRVGPSADLATQLLDGALDAAVIVEPLVSGRSGTETPAGIAADVEDRPGTGLDLVELLTEDLAIYAPGPVAGRAPAPVDDPSRWGPWVTFPPESHTRRHIAKALRRLGSEFRVEAQSHQPEVLRQMVHLGMGWTVLPVLQAETDPNPLVRARTKPLLSRRLVLATRTGHSADAATTELMDLLLKRAATIGAAGND